MILCEVDLRKKLLSNSRDATEPYPTSISKKLHSRTMFYGLPVWPTNRKTLFWLSVTPRRLKELKTHMFVLPIILQLPYAEGITTTSDSLANLRVNPEVAALRDTHSADLVQHIGFFNDNFCGRGWVKRMTLCRATFPISTPWSARKK